MTNSVPGYVTPKRGYEADWLTADPVLLDGQMIIVYIPNGAGIPDTVRTKFGRRDPVTGSLQRYSSLPFSAPDGPKGDSGTNGVDGVDWLPGTNGVDGAPGAAIYDVPVIFYGDITGGEELGGPLLARQTEIGANFGGSVASLRSAPNVPFVVEVRAGVTLVGTISFDTTGLITFSTTGTLPITIPAGTEMSFVSIQSVTGIAALKITIKANAV
jgi:hypothetical protein